MRGKPAKAHVSNREPTMDVRAMAREQHLHGEFIARIQNLRSGCLRGQDHYSADPQGSPQGLPQGHLLSQ